MSRLHPRYTRNNPALPAIIPNLWKIVLKGRIEVQATQNTFYYADGGAVLTAATETLAIAAWQAAFAVNWPGMTSTDWLAESVTMECVNLPLRVPVSRPAIVGMNGAIAGGHVGTEQAIIVLRNSGVRGQCGRGRISIPGVPLTFVTGSSLNVVGLGGMVANGGIIGTGFVVGAVTYTPQIYSKGSHAFPTQGASPILSVTFDNVLGTCRRRKLGRGI